MSKTLAEKTRNWITGQTMPLWSSRGIDWEQGGFVENVSTAGARLDGSKRSMVQARQIYSFRIAAELGAIDKTEAKRAIEHSADFLVKNAFLPSGAAAHCVDRSGKVINEMPDLYAQAFVVFGLANAFRVSPKPEYREKAKALVRYLDAERRVRAGGFTEVKDGGTQYQSNPHMHLFEASLAWVELDADPLWRSLADEIAGLCETKFIDRETRLLAEHFDEQWAPLRVEGRFVFEPGHQYEWAWLLCWHERLTGHRSRELSERLFDTSERHGIWRPRNTAYDEVWSDFTPKKRSSRFWPQCERIKAAVRLGQQASADEALSTLFKYLEHPVPGLWHDTWQEDDQFTGDPVKSSSLYHIIGAMYEYLKAT